MTSTAERFEERVTPEPNSGCWLWTGASYAAGYGGLQVGKRTELAHRVSWRLFRGPIPKDLCVLHRCDVRVCVNPDHLFLGTRADNQADMAAKGRAARGQGHGRAKLTQDEAQIIQSAPGTLREIAARFGVSRAQVSRIKNGKSWSHLTKVVRYS